MIEMLLAIDVGNTRVKYAVYEHNTCIDNGFFDKLTLKTNIEKILFQFKEIKNMVIASVSDVEKKAFLKFENKIFVHFIHHEDRFPFVNKYETPKTLGIDRMVLAAGAVINFPKQNILVIDAGTCITYDFIDENNNYLGGAISPGIRLRYESLHNYTAKLPLLTKELPNHFIGNNTTQSIHSGIVNGIINEIEGFIANYESQFSKFIIILTGGDTDFLAKRLKNTIFANPNFLLESLKDIFYYKNQK